MPTLLVSPVAGLPVQVSMCPIHVGASAAGGQGPAFMGLLFLWGWMWQKGWHPGLSEELLPHGVWVTWRWRPHSHLGEGVWGKGSLGRSWPGRLEEQQEDQCVWGEWAGGQEGAGLWAMGRGPEVGWKPWMVQSRGGMWSDVGVKRVLWYTGGVTAEAVTSLTNAEETAAWA